MSALSPNAQDRLDDALGLCRAGELAARQLEEPSDRDAFQAVFRAIENHLRDVHQSAGHQRDGGADV